MSIMKRRLAVILTCCLAFTSAFLFMPQKENYVEAATVKKVKIELDELTHYNEKGDYVSNASIVVEKGAKNLYMGDFALARISYTKGNSIRPLSYTSNITYTSSKPSVLSVNKKTGQATVKKTGNAKVTYQYKKGGKIAKKTLQVKVVKRGKYLNNKATKKSMDNTYAKIKKYVGEKITASNRYAVAKAFWNYNQTADENAEGDYYYGCCIRCGLSYSKINYNDINIFKLSNIVLEPKMMRTYAFGKYVESYQKEVNPFATHCAKMYSVVKADSSFTAGTKKGTITVNRKVTADDLFMARVFNQKFKAADTANHRIYVMDPSDCTIIYEASLKMKKNSKKMELKIVDGYEVFLNSPEDGEAYTDVRNVSIDDFSFEKGKQYYLLETYGISDDMDNLCYTLVTEKTWTKNIKITAK